MASQREGLPVVGSPTNVTRELHVSVDPDGNLVGLPDEFLDALRNPAKQAASGANPSGNAAPTGFFTSLFGSSSLQSGVSSGSIGGGGGGGGGSGSGSSGGGGGSSGAVEISGPLAGTVRRVVHVELDTSSRFGMRGLPTEWEALLNSSGISREQVERHPQETLDVLKFHTEGRGGGRPALPKQAALEASLQSARESILDVTTDPTTLFTLNEGHKLGEGVSGVVKLGADKRSGKKVAIKIAPAKDMEHLKNEIALQAMSAHPSIVSLVGVFLHKEDLWVRGSALLSGRAQRGAAFPTHPQVLLVEKHAH